MSYMIQERMTPAEFAKIRSNRLGLSQQELANMMDVSIATIQKWEQGASPIRKTIVLAIKYLCDQSKI